MIQRAESLVDTKLNVVGENHAETEGRLKEEKEYCHRKTGSDNYWDEAAFLYRPQVGAVPTFGDPVEQRALQAAAGLVYFAENKILPAAEQAVASNGFISQEGNEGANLFMQKGQYLDEETEQYKKYWEQAYKASSWREFDQARVGYIGKFQDLFRIAKKQSEKQTRSQDLAALRELTNRLREHWTRWRTAADSKNVRGGLERVVEGVDKGVSMERSIYMDEAAKGWGRTLRGVWKIGEHHVQDILDYRQAEPVEYNLVNRASFNKRLKEDK